MSQLYEDQLQQIRHLGYRLTPQRVFVWQALAQLKGHATANQVYALVQEIAPTLNRATVYRTLAFLHRLELVSESQINGATVYEIREEQPHHHLVCQHCGEIAVIGGHHFTALTHHLSQQHGFAAALDHVTIPGICAACQG